MCWLQDKGKDDLVGKGGGRIRGLLYSGRKSLAAVSGSDSGGVGRLRSDRPRRPGSKMAGAHLLGLDSKEEWYFKKYTTLDY